MTPGGKRVIMVAAVADNGVIGADGEIPWKIPEDFAHFRRTTLGHTLIIGRTTHEGIGRPLPDRSTIVLTTDTSWRDEGVLIANDLHAAFALADDLPGEVMIGGGAVVYAAAMPYADVQIISEIPRRPNGDTHYPRFDRLQWREAHRQRHEGFQVVRWERITD